MATAAWQGTQRELALHLVARLAELDPVMNELSKLVVSTERPGPENDGSIEHNLWVVLLFVSTALNEARAFLTGSTAQRLDAILARALAG